MSQNAVRKRLLDALLIVKRDGPKTKNEGICTAVVHALGNLNYLGDLEVDALLDKAMSTWPKKSTSCVFPVGNGLHDYDAHRRAGDMWDPETEYGRLRLELLDHCIAHLQGE